MTKTAKIKNAIKRVRKALAGAAAAVVVVVLRRNGVELDVAVIQTLLEAAFISGTVYIVPNAAPIVEDEDI